MKVAILGSSGQIGAYLTEYLRKKGHEVIEFDKTNNSTQDLTRIPNYNLHGVIMEADFVFFLAFDVGGSHYLKKYQHTFGFLDNNARMLTNVFGKLSEFKKPFVFASSQMSNMSYSPYGVMKRVGELYTKSLNGFETGTINMMTDGTEQREFLYAEDCCEALETVMHQYDDFTSDSDIHITSFTNTTILEIGKIIQGLFRSIDKKVTLNPAQAKDEVQKDARNEANPHIRKWWKAKTSIEDGIEKVFEEMRKDYENI